MSSTFREYMSMALRAIEAAGYDRLFSFRSQEELRKGALIPGGMSMYVKVALWCYRDLIEVREGKIPELLFERFGFSPYEGTPRALIVIKTTVPETVELGVTKLYTPSGKLLVPYVSGEGPTYKGMWMCTEEIPQCDYDVIFTP